MLDDSRFTVISYNVRGLENILRIHELTIFLTTHKPSVLILQEPKMDHRTTKTKTDRVTNKQTVTPRTPQPLPKFTGYIGIYFKHPTLPTGIIFYIHKSCQYKTLDHIEHCTPYAHDKSGTTAAFVWIKHPKLSQPVVVGGVYLHDQSTEKDVATLAKNIARASHPLPGSPPGSIPLPLFILGDFNARHKLWDPHIDDTKTPNNRFGNWIHKRLVIHNTARTLCARLPPLTLINNMFTTTHKAITREESGSVIDLALTSHANMIQSMHVMSNTNMGSDHFPLALTLKEIDISSHAPYAVLTHAPTGTEMEKKIEEEINMERKYDEREEEGDEKDEKNGTPHPRHIRPTSIISHDTHTSTSHPHINTQSLPSFYIQTSTIAGAGYGFYANRRYKKGERIIVYTGEVITRAQKEERYPDREKGGRYVVYVMNDMYIDAIDPSISSAARYINSSGGGYNNAAMHPQHTNNTHSINIVATCDIAPGEEVFMPYGSSYHMTRAPPPNRNKQTTPDNTWEQHMIAPKHTQTDGRVKWKVNENVDWSLFRDHIKTPLTTWTQKYKAWMPSKTQQEQEQQQRQEQQRQQQQARVSPIEGTVHVVMYTDGASRGNPGPASCGGVIYLARDKITPEATATATPIHTYNTLLGIATNNEAEYHGLLQGLKAACEMGATHVHAYADSQLMCKQIQGKYTVTDRNPKLQQIHEQCRIHISQLTQFNITHIPRKYNAEADKQCNIALDASDTYASDIPDMMDGHDTGLNDEQKQNIIQAQLKQQQQDEQDMKEERDMDNTNMTRPTHITQEEIDTCFKDIHDAIINAAEAGVGQVRRKPDSKYWWAVAPDIHTLQETMARKRRMIRKMKREIDVSVKNNTRHNITPQILSQTRKDYREAKRLFISNIKKAKSKEWSETAGAVDTYTHKHKHTIAWKKWKRTKPSTRVAAASFANKDGMPPTDATEALNNMAAHIARISSLPRSAMYDAVHEARVLQYVRDHIPERPLSPHAPSFSFTDVEQACTSFRLNTALGADNVSPYFLRHGGKQLHRAVYMLFYICSWYGVAPTAFRHGHVMTLYKGDGDQTDPDNYRPITITSVLARVYERIHKNELLAEMIKGGIPSKDQFGFTRQRSTHDAIYRLLSLIVETSSQGDNDPSISPLQRHVPTVFIDISKAYDKVWIDGLLYKLHHDLGITGNLFYMIRAMLTKRTIQVVCDGKISTMYVMEEGVAQGSILAPLLFLIYIHELTQTRDEDDNICMSLFADDIALLPLRIGDDGINVLNHALDRMSAYARKWKITFSAKKTNVVYFKPGFRGPKGYTPPHSHGMLKLTNFPIECAQAYEYLGVRLDQFLTFIPYVRDLIKKLTATSHTISRLVRRDHAPSIPVIHTLVKTVLIPSMVYGFAFIPPRWLKFKKHNIKVTGITDTSTTHKLNMHKMLKRHIVTPLMRCTGQPYYVCHDALFTEMRTLNILSQQSLSCMRLAHRWMSNHLDATNEAGRMFREHVTNPPTHRSHPFNYIKQGITATFPLFTTNPRAFTQLTRPRLKELVWDKQYTEFTTRNTTPLHKQYNTTHITQRTLPTYTHMDTPKAASNRARLRFGRARLRFDQKRLKFQDITSTRCRQCKKAEETVKHVIDICDAPAVIDLRQRMTHKLTRLCTKYKENIAEVGNILNPTAKQTRVMKRAHTITGQYINMIRDIWDF